MPPILLMTAAALFASIIPGYAVKAGNAFPDRTVHCINFTSFCHKKKGCQMVSFLFYL